MKTKPENPRKKLDPKELIALCNEKMVMAARDLAEFTKHGMYANYIVSLAQKCEDYQNAISSPFQNYNMPMVEELEHLLIVGLVEICDKGKAIWNGNPSRYQNYLLPEIPMFTSNNNNRNAA